MTSQRYGHDTGAFSFRVYFKRIDEIENALLRRLTNIILYMMYIIINA